MPGNLTENITMTFWINLEKYPFSLPIFGKNNLPCFGDLISEVDASLEKNGFEIGIEKINSSTSCGLDKISNLLGKWGRLSHEADGFLSIINHFQEIGYRPGVNLFSLGYDWRKKPGKNEVFKNLKQLLMISRFLNKKKAIIISHSYGSLNTLHFLNTKDFIANKYIERWISVGGPLGGATAAIETIVGQNDPMSGKISKENLAKVVQNLEGIWALLPKEFEKNQKNSNFIKEFNKKWDCDYNCKKFCFEHRNMTKEKMKKCEKQNCFCHKNKFNFWSSPKDKCENVSCDGFTKIFNYFEKPYIQNENNEKSFKKLEKTFLYKNILKFNKDKVSEEKIDLILKTGEDDQIFNLKNPQVPITIIFGSFSQETGEIMKDPKNNIKTFGDSRVTTFSALIPPLKWALDYNENKKGNFPIEFVEVCGKFRQKKNLELWKKNKKNVFYGINCEENTSHSTFFNDKNVIQLISSIATAGKQNKLKIPNLSYEKIQELCLPENQDFMSLIEEKIHFGDKNFSFFDVFRNLSTETTIDSLIEMIKKI